MSQAHEIQKVTTIGGWKKVIVTIRHRLRF